MPLKIYYLDDEEALCEIFNHYFASQDVTVSTFIDPKVAIDAIKNNPPDIFFTDYRLPGTTGDAVAKALDPRLPKFLITGDTSVITEYKFIRVLPKPYPEQEIAEIISSYMTAKAA